MPKQAPDWGVTMKTSSLMQPKHIALLIAALYAPASFAAIAARVEFSAGDPVLLGIDGKERPVKKGDVLAPGERIRTRSGRVQLAFTDGAFVSLQPETDFGVDQYEFQGKTDGSEKGFFSMLKGSLRTITGMIGRGRRDAYKIVTPTATIGIRSTGGLVQVSDAGTYIFGTSGTWTLTNNAGTLNIPAGTPGFAGSSGDTPPQTGGSTPSAPPPGSSGSSLLDQSGGTTFVSADQTTSSGTSTAVGPTLLMAGGAGYTVYHVSDLDMGTIPANLASVTNSTTTFITGNILNSFSDAVFNIVQQPTSSVGESGNDGIVGWGRWTGAYKVDVTTNTLLPNQGLHYVVGIPTSSMPTGFTATYSLLGATSPTEKTGLLSPGTLNSFSFDVNFSTFTISNLSLVLTNSSGVYNMTGSGTFSGNTLNASMSSTTGPCAGSNCWGSASGVFYGASAERAGVIYSIWNDSLGYQLNGAAALKR